MKRVEFFFDLTSPYSYLAATQLDGLARRTGSEIVWKPLALGAVFKATGNAVPALCQPKARYMLADLGRWARRYGVRFQMNSRFPMNSMRGMRLIVAAEASGHSGALAQRLFAAAWAEERDIASDDELRIFCREAGLDPEPLLAAVETQAVKDRLRAYGEEAVARGVFGAPAMFIGDQLFWGNDRLDFVEAALTAA